MMCRIDDGAVPGREQARLVGCSQQGAMEVFNATRRMCGRNLTTRTFVTGVQHRLGLNITELSGLAGDARGNSVDYLGDYEINRSDRRGPHDAVLDTWVHIYRATGDATVAKGDKQEGSSKAARFDANTVVDIVRETTDGKLIGSEIKCLNTVKQNYSKGTQGSHRDNGHAYAFGNTREAVMRTVVGAQRRGSETDAWFDHATGEGFISGRDWVDTERGKVKPAYKDALTQGNDLRVLVHEVWGGMDAGAEAEMEQQAGLATALLDATNYAGSNAIGAFATHWTRRLSSVVLLAHGQLINAVGSYMAKQQAREEAFAAREIRATVDESVLADGGEAAVDDRAYSVPRDNEASVQQITGDDYWRGERMIVLPDDADAHEADAATERCAQVDVAETCGECCEESDVRGASEAVRVMAAAAKRQRVAAARPQAGHVRSNVRKSPRLAACGCDSACAGVSHA